VKPPPLRLGSALNYRHIRRPGRVMLQFLRGVALSASLMATLAFIPTTADALDYLVSRGQTVRQLISTVTGSGAVTAMGARRLDDLH
jgi:hypothetical protein